MLYQEPNPLPIDIDNNMPLDRKEINDFTYKGLSDYKKAYSLSLKLKNNIPERTLDSLLKERDSSKKVLIIYNNSKYSGNYFTALRISKYFLNSKMLNLKEIEFKNIFDNVKDKYEHIIAVHLHKCSQYLQDFKIPYTIIMGGTDCYLDDNDKLENYYNILNRSLSVVVFNQSMKKLIEKNYKGFNKNINIIPQSVDIVYQPEEIKEKIYYLWVGKLRKIKDPELFINLALDNPIKNFIMIGEVSKEYENYKFPENLKYLGTKDRNTVLNYINKAECLINTSIEEGMSDVILSALGLGTKVIARNNSGNLEIIKNLKTGYIFKTKTELNNLINSKLNDITLNGKIYIHNNHNFINENLKYQNLIN